jgi:hypothetical protein
MSFALIFEKFAGPVDSAVAVDRADITMSDGGSGANSSKSNKLMKGNSSRDRGGSQSQSGNLTGNFGSEKEVDPDRFPHKSWTNSRIPG